MNSFDIGFLKRAADYGIAETKAKNILLHVKRRMAKQAIYNNPHAQQLPSSGLQAPALGAPSSGGSAPLGRTVAPKTPNMPRLPQTLNRNNMFQPMSPLAPPPQLF